MLNILRHHRQHDLRQKGEFEKKLEMILYFKYYNTMYILVQCSENVFIQGFIQFLNSLETTKNAFTGVRFCVEN